MKSRRAVSLTGLNGDRVKVIEEQRATPITQGQSQGSSRSAFFLSAEAAQRALFPVRHQVGHVLLLPLTWPTPNTISLILAPSRLTTENRGDGSVTQAILNPRGCGPPVDDRRFLISGLGSQAPQTLAAGLHSVL